VYALVVLLNIKNKGKIVERIPVLHIWRRSRVENVEEGGGYA
jgi:hypothetical protein